VDLFADPLASRIRVCAAPDRGLLSLDQSRSGTWQWLFDAALRNPGQGTGAPQASRARADGDG
jgi:predicted RNA-binding Zn ribbon-like protein